MNRKLILNDYQNNKLVTVLTTVFMAISAMLLCLSILLFFSLSTSIDRLMEQAMTPDFLQMHAGIIDEAKIMDFAERTSTVEKVQVSEFLNLENSELSIGDKTLSDSTQDNGLCVQNPYFDYLLDIDGNIIEVEPGEVYIPICYRREYDAMIGEDFHIGSEVLSIAGFLRDSQMNSMMASSKRFLVSDEDFEKLSSLGTKEYLIEFKLKMDADIDGFASAYAKEGLPGNGPTITYALIKLMNALSDGIMIFVILLVSFVVLVISLICIKNILLTGLEKDKREIGMQRALGISVKEIKKHYIAKFFILALMGATVGQLAAIAVAVPLSGQMNELYGAPDHMSMIYAISITGTVGVELIILLSISRNLNRLKKLSTMDVLYDRIANGKKAGHYVFISIIVAAAVALIVIPTNIASTLSSPKFVTNMGIGDSQIRIDIRQNDDIDKITDSLKKSLESDGRVSDYVCMTTASYDVKLSDGSSYKMLIENGDHSKYPVSYSKGRYPTCDGEIALSGLNAEELEVDLDDELIVNGRKYVVCGIYSDITNGGKTAKAYMSDKNEPIWSIFYLNAVDENLVESIVEEYQTTLSKYGKGIKVTEISAYVSATYGQTISDIRLVSMLVTIASGLVIFVVVLLFIRLIVWQERTDISMKKALGLTGGEIKEEYLQKLVLYIFAGVCLGTLIGVFPGERVAGMMLKSLGASGFRFIINPLDVFLFIPFLGIAVAVLASWMSLIEIDNIKTYECLVDRE